MTRSDVRPLAMSGLATLFMIAACEPSAPASPGASVATVPAAPTYARGADSPQDQSVIAALKAYEAAILASDTVTLKQIWADDYIFINAQGVLSTRAQRLANFASGVTNVVEAVNQRDIVVHVYGDNAVTFQLFTLRGRFGGVETNTEVRGSFTWIKRAGRWQLVANQVIPVL